MQFLRQYDEYSCGPIAVINTLRFVGYKLTVGDYKMVYKACGTTKDGTRLRGVHSGLAAIQKRLKIRGSHVAYVDKIGMDDIFILLENGNAVLMDIVWVIKSEGRVGHFFIITGHSPSKKTFYVINGPSSEKAEGRISRKKLRWMMRHWPKRYPKAWIINPEPIFPNLHKWWERKADKKKKGK